MRGANIPEVEGEASAIYLLEKLYQVPHGAMMLYLTNVRAARNAFPATIDEAYTILKEWKSFSAQVVDSHGVIATGVVFR